MDLMTVALFLLAAAAVAVAPGPSTLLVLSHALSGDGRRPASLIAGAFCGNLLLVLVTVLGLSAVILASQTAFEIIRWVGAGYLIYLGIRYWRAPVDPIDALPTARAARYRALFLQALLTSITNPKGLVFYFAFLPQFAGAGAPSSGWLALLGLTYVALFVAALLLYALLGRRLAGYVASPRILRLKNRVTGGLLIAAGLSLLRAERA